MFLDEHKMRNPFLSALSSSIIITTTDPSTIIYLKKLQSVYDYLFVIYLCSPLTKLIISALSSSSTTDAEAAAGTLF